MTGPLADSPVAIQQGHVRTRVRVTLLAIQDAIWPSLQRHFNAEFALFERSLLVNEPQKRKR